MKELGIRISGSSSSSAVEASIKPLIFHDNKNHHYLRTTSGVSYKVVLSRGWGPMERISFVYIVTRDHKKFSFR